MERSKVMGRIPRIAFVCLMLGLILGLMFPEAVLAEGPYYATKEEAVSHVPTHVVPKDCFVWKDGLDPTKPWRVIPGTGCAHWVAHELGLGIASPWQKWERGEIEPPLPPEAWQVCYDGFYIRVADVIAGRTLVEIKDAKVGDIWTNDDCTHCGIVRQVAGDKVLVEHDSSAQGGAVQTWFTSGKCWRLKHGLDLIFTIDTTGSMWDDIDNVKASASTIINEIDVEMFNYRIAVVDYRDFPVSPYGGARDYPFHDVLPFSTDKSSIIAAIQALTLGWGADWRESVYSALMHSIDATSLGGWRGSDKAVKIIILMGDAPPHDPEPFTGYTLSTVIDAAERADPVHVYPIQIGGAVEKFNEIAEQTGGKTFTAEGAEEVANTILEALEVIAEAPVAEAGPDQTVYQGDTVVLDGSGSYDLDGTLVLYEWDAEGDGIYEWSSPTTGITTHVYETTGIYHAILRVTDDDGLQDTDFAIITVEPSPEDTTPPRTTMFIGSPQYTDLADNLYVTSDTLFTLVAVDNNGAGSGVANTAYKIYNATYDTGWIISVPPISFQITGVDDGAYTIDYYSTDNAGNVEPINTVAVILDNTPPLLTIETPLENEALQDGVTFQVSAWDLSEVSSVTFSIQCAQGNVISPEFESMPATFSPEGKWELSFDTTQLPDGFYLAIVNGTDVLGNTGVTTVPFSIRNWACVELLPASESNKAGRTMPVKFSLRIVALVDPNQPFVRNEELTIVIFETGNPENILQISTYGSTSRDYRIDGLDELYITNFKTLKTPMCYTVEIYRKGMLIGSFEFQTVK